MKKFFTWLFAFLQTNDGFGKYLGSPWGKIRGKLNGSVGGAWKGIDWVRVLVIPTTRGSIEKYRAFKAGTIGSFAFSYKQFNIRHAVVNVLGFLTRKFYSSLVIVWHDYLLKHPGLKLSEMNAFTKENIARFFASMPNKNGEYVAATNAPLLTSLKVSKGDLEPVQTILTAVYTTGTGALVFTWATGIFENGLATDKIFWAVAKKPILESDGVAGTFNPSLYLYGMADAGSTRTTGTDTVTLPTGLTATDLTLYVFLQDLAGTIGYSDSKALQVSAA